ncbi:hypothetical protein [Stenotrophomonas maltophilia]|uniref:Uncharacterized protein n=1 Tax=Stenotrophomonas maltophilia TaxID=40324 RepID=A0A4S2D4G1_STEMA|nr:hypothetical protein [Stenotrophomonas maltophilia]TGY35214.1 hypothetical protein E5352_05700 [Stenotrophomonas maltophilia]
MNTEHIEKFVNAIACDLEEGGFRQVSGTTLRRSLTEGVVSALPLLADTGIPASQPAELAEQQGDVREQFEAWAKGRDLTPDTWGVSSYVSPHVDNDWDVWRAAWKVLATTGKQQTGHVLENARITMSEDDFTRMVEGEAGEHGEMLEDGGPFSGWCFSCEELIEFSRGIINAWGMERRAQEAVFAAIGEQQIGEIQGDALLKLADKWDHAKQVPRYVDNDGVHSCSDELRALASRQPGTQEPVEMTAEFTDTGRAAIAWVLWHHQGGSSPVGQPLRFALGMGQHDRMTDQQIAEAKRFAAWAGATTESFHRRSPAQGIDMGQFNALAALANAIVHHRGESPMKNGVFAEAERLLALIGQRDAAPGVE